MLKAILIIIYTISIALLGGCAGRSYIGEYTDQRISKSPHQRSFLLINLRKSVSYGKIDPNGNKLIMDEVNKLLNTNQRQYVTLIPADTPLSRESVLKLNTNASQAIRIEASIFVGHRENVYKYEPNMVIAMTRDRKIVVADENHLDLLGLCDVTKRDGTCITFPTSPNVSAETVIKTIEHSKGDYSITVVDLETNEKVFTTKYVGSFDIPKDIQGSDVNMLSKAIVAALIKNNIIPE